MTIKSMPTAFTDRGYTAEEITLDFKVDRISRTVTIPKGTACVKLDESKEGWVVQDLSFIEDKNSILYSDADIYGIRLPSEKIANSTPVSKEEYDRTEAAQNRAMGKQVDRQRG